MEHESVLGKDVANLLDGDTTHKPAYILAADQKFLKEHAERRGSRWMCKKTGAIIRVTETGRSIWHRPFMGGSGEVCQVGHLHCPECQPQFSVPSYGTPIYDDELIKVG
jgi:hypothetical protein